MTPIFIHTEGPLYQPSRPYRLSAVTHGRSRVFEANIVWEGIDVFDDEISRRVPFGKYQESSGGEVVACCGDSRWVSERFHAWLEDCGANRELWTKSIQGNWREMHALGLHILPVYDLSTYVRLAGFDFAVESLRAHREAVAKGGATSPKTGAYEAELMFQYVKSKRNISK